MAATVKVQSGPGVSRISGSPDRSVRRLMERAARAVLRHARAGAPAAERPLFGEAEISITLLDDVEIAAMNAQFLQHEGTTDVISFTLYEHGEPPVGDIYIGVDQARVQSAAAGVELEEELVRLTVHGVLHVLGHDHPEGVARLKSDMWQLQETIVAEVLAA